MRLPPRPDLHWKDDGTPIDQRIGDVYYSVEDGLAEARAVFLAGNGLPDVWDKKPIFTIAELGFGTGLNFLAAWQMWRQHRPTDGWLNFVSFEGFPLDVEDVERALKPWPELKDLAAQLCAKWPPRAKGVRHLTWPEEKISLILHIGLIEETLPQSEFHADAWFLDGFSPAKNTAMWDETLWPLVAERSSKTARAATFTVAGAVRRGLAGAGFTVEKRPGHGRKRERLEAAFHANETLEQKTPKIPKIGIVGAGIAGACLAHALSARGAQSTVFDTGAQPAQGTSGNPLALVMPRLDAADTVQARLLIDAYLSAQAFYQDLPGVTFSETVHTPRNDQEAERFQRLLADPPLELDQLEAIPANGLLHKRSIILEPRKLIPELLQRQNVRWETTARLDVGSRSIDDEPFDAIILAAGWQLQSLMPNLDLVPRLGQIEFFESEITSPPQAIARGDYALAQDRFRLWGATFEDHSGGAPQVKEASRQKNQTALEALNPFWRREAERSETSSRAGVRATTADRLPLIGPAPDVSRLNQDCKQLERLAWSVPPESYAIPGVYISGGFGSRGFTWAPWAANILSAMIFEDPLPVRREALQMIVPNRQTLRKLKRAPNL